MQYLHYMESSQLGWLSATNTDSFFMEKDFETQLSKLTKSHLQFKPLILSLLSQVRHLW